MRVLRRLVLAGLFATGIVSAAGAASWTTVDIGTYSNWRLQSQGGLTGVPTGVSNFAGVPFLVDVSGFNAWNSDIVAGANPHVLDVPVSVRSVTSVHLLLNTIWGQGTGTYCTIAVRDSAGRVDSLQLVGNQHFRDYNTGSFTTTVNGTTTVQGWSDGSCGVGAKQLDMFTLTLPANWAGRRVTDIKVIDTGANGFQRSLVAGITLETPDAIAHMPVDLGPACNYSLKSNGGMGAEPAGIVDLGGEPFATPATGNDSWSAELAGTNPVMLTLPIGRHGIATLHTLINTMYGQYGPTSYATISCFYEGGHRFDLPLVGGVDMRDWNSYVYTNTINGTTTQNVWNNGACAQTVGHRLDMQTITLPTAWVAARLDSIRFTDTGATNVQRIVLHGLTLDGDASVAGAGVERPVATMPALQVFPNPAGATFALTLGERPGGGAATIEVVDVHGRRVGRRLAVPEGDRQVRIGAAELGTRLSPGVYFVHVRTAGASTLARVVVLP